MGGRTKRKNFVMHVRKKVARLKGKSEGQGHTYQSLATPSCLPPLRPMFFFERRTAGLKYYGWKDEKEELWRSEP